MSHNSFRSYIVISPVKNEKDYVRQTLDSVVAQTERPSLWIIVDDGSDDIETPKILQEYAAKHEWIKIVTRAQGRRRKVGAGVVEAFYAGLERVRIEEHDYLCKLDMDLVLPRGYFAGLMDKMEDDPRLGSTSGKTYYIDRFGLTVDEGIADEMSVGASKFMRVACFKQIDGFAREVMWDGIDCHKARLRGWKAHSWTDEHLAFEHLRPMGSSEQSIWKGRYRHGFGQFYMGSDPLFFLVAAVYKMRQRPFILGSLVSVWAYFKSWITGVQQIDDPELRNFIRVYQRKALFKGKARAIREIEHHQREIWSSKI